MLENMAVKTKPKSKSKAINKLSPKEDAVWPKVITNNQLGRFDVLHYINTPWWERVFTPYTPE